jgi:hypothetical protein
MDLYVVIAGAHSSAPDSNHFLFTALDLKSGYQQILLDPSTAHKLDSRPKKERSFGKD